MTVKLIKELIKEWLVEKCKSDRLFKAKVLIAVLIFIAIIVEKIY